MIPKGYVSHELRNRLRVHIPSKRRDREYFARLQKELKRVHGVDDVVVNSTTATVLILHHASSSELTKATRKSNLFALVRPGEPGAMQPWSETFFENLDRLDGSLREWSNGRWDMPTVVGSSIFFLGVMKALEGDYLPTAWALFGQALNVMRQGRSRPMLYR